MIVRLSEPGYELGVFDCVIQDDTTAIYWLVNGTKIDRCIARLKMKTYPSKLHFVGYNEQDEIVSELVKPIEELTEWDKIAFRDTKIRLQLMSRIVDMYGTEGILVYRTKAGKRCPYCYDDVTGEIVNSDCPHCGGTGRVISNTAVKSRVVFRPAGRELALEKLGFRLAEGPYVITNCMPIMTTADFIILNDASYSVEAVESRIRSRFTPFQGLRLAMVDTADEKFFNIDSIEVIELPK